MFRIFRHALMLLAGTLLCASLIAARPLPPVTPVAPASPAALASLLDPPARQIQANLSHAPATRELGPALQPIESVEAEVAIAHTLPSQPQPAVIAPAPAVIAPARIAGDGPRMAGTLVAQTARLDLYVGKNTFSPGQVAELASLLELLLRKDEARLGTTLKRRVSIAFYRAALAPKRGVRGMAFTDSGRAELYYRPYEDPERAATVAAHELGHQLEVQRYGEAAQRRADTILHEGMATWIAGHRWLTMCDATTWHERARQLRDAGVPLRLLTAERSGADNAYELWASFVHFLTLRYGWEKLDALYISGRGRAPGSANYQHVLGKSLDELADEWREWVNQ
jgi:hypothetical protein